MQRHQANPQRRFRSSIDSSSDDGNLLAVLLEDEEEGAFCMMGLTGEKGNEAREPTAMKKALFAPDANEWMNRRVFGSREVSRMKNSC